MDEVILTVAAVGAEQTKEHQPGLPTTPEELAGDAIACRDAGASIYHLHVRDRSGSPTMSVEAFAEAKAAIEESTDLVVQFTTGGAVSDREADRMAPLELRPEMATLTTGSVNFADDVFLNRPSFVAALYARMIDLGVIPEYEIFDTGMIATAARLFEKLEASHHRHYDFVLNVPGGMPAWPGALGFLTAKLPPEATWSATGVGKSHLEVTRDALELGGHIRTGLEDVSYYEAGSRATSNAQLIERVARMASESGRGVASPADARRVLGIDTRQT
jgi:3-keto-5-aminohexanoate cleavage enzyme